MRETVQSVMAGLRRLLQALCSRFLDTLREQWAGVRAMQMLMRTAPLTSVGLLVLLATIVATAYFSQPGQHLPSLSAELWEGNVISVPSPSLYISLVVVSFGWAFVLVGATLISLPVYVLAASYVSFYALSPGLSVARSIWFVLVPVWILLLGGWCRVPLRPLWRVLLLGWLSLVTAWITYPTLGMARILPPSGRDGVPTGTAGRLALAGLYLALAAGPWTLRAPRLRPGRAFAVTWLLLVSFYGYAALQSPPSDLLADTFVAFYYLLGMLSLFWIWLGLDLFTSAQSTAWWLADTLRSVLSQRILTLSILPLWAIGAFTSYLLVHGPSLGLTRFLSRQGPVGAGWSTYGMEYLLTQNWGRSLQNALRAYQPTVPLALALDYWLYILLAVLALSLILRIRKRLSPTWLTRLFGLSLIALLVLYGHFGTLFSLASEDWEAALGFWPLLVFVGGMFWEAFKASSGRVAQRETNMFLVGLLLVFAAISMLELSAGYAYFKKELSLNPFIGALYLGLPYVLYVLLREWGLWSQISGRNAVSLFLLGMVTAVPCLALGHPLLAPVLWQLLVLATVWREEGWTQKWVGVVYAGAAALGFVVFYTHPVVLPVPPLPFLSKLVQGQVGYAERVIWPWEARWWGLLLAAAAAATLLGYLLSRARTTHGWGRVFYLAVAPALSVAFLAFCGAMGVVKW